MTAIDEGGGEVFAVDDNPANLGLLASILRDAGLTVRVAQSGRRALVAIRAQVPELVLLDVSMPEMDGYQVCAELRADPATRDVPVIFLSALSDVADKLDAFRVGGQDYVTKPFQGEEVLARVRMQLSLSRSRRDLMRANASLARKNEQLAQAWADADQIFGAYADMLEGTILDGEYRLEEKVGAGGTAAVYRAVQLSTGQAVAVKVTRPQPGAEEYQRRRSVNEGLNTVLLDHPNAVRVLATGTTQSGVTYLVMELYSGGSFHDLLAEGPIDLGRAVAILAPVCRALAAAHALGIIHRDVKPGNVVLHREPDGREMVKVVDFGIARTGDDHESGTLTTVGRVIGTPIYLAPERLLARPYDGRVDVYAIGMTLFRAVAGRFPFDVSDDLGAVLFTCIHVEPARLSELVEGVPAALDDLVARLLAKAPEQRPTMAELAGLLEDAAQGAAPTRARTAPAAAPAAASVEDTLEASVDARASCPLDGT